MTTKGIGYKNSVFQNRPTKTSAKALSKSRLNQGSDKTDLGTKPDGIKINMERLMMKKREMAALLKKPKGKLLAAGGAVMTVTAGFALGLAGIAMGLGVTGYMIADSAKACFTG